MVLTLEEQAAYAQAKQQNYLVRKVGQQELESVYHELCVSEQTYWISIHLHESPCSECSLEEDHVTLWYDLFHLHQALTPEAYQTLREDFARFRPGAYRNTSINLGEAGGYGIVPEYAAEKLAKSLARLFSNPQTHSEEMFYRVYPQHPQGH